METRSVQSAQRSTSARRLSAQERLGVKPQVKNPLKSITKERTSVGKEMDDSAGRSATRSQRSEASALGSAEQQDTKSTMSVRQYSKRGGTVFGLFAHASQDVETASVTSSQSAEVAANENTGSTGKASDSLEPSLLVKNRPLEQSGEEQNNSKLETETKGTGEQEPLQESAGTNDGGLLGPGFRTTEAQERPDGARDPATGVQSLRTAVGTSGLDIQNIASTTGSDVTAKENSEKQNGGKSAIVGSALDNATVSERECPELSKKESPVLIEKESPVSMEKDSPIVPRRQRPRSASESVSDALSDAQTLHDKTLEELWPESNSLDRNTSHYGNNAVAVRSAKLQQTADAFQIGCQVHSARLETNGNQGENERYQGTLDGFHNKNAAESLHNKTAVQAAMKTSGVEVKRLEVLGFDVRMNGCQVQCEKVAPTAGLLPESTTRSLGSLDSHTPKPKHALSPQETMTIKLLPEAKTMGSGSAAVAGACSQKEKKGAEGIEYSCMLSQAKAKHPRSKSLPRSHSLTLPHRRLSTLLRTAEHPAAPAGKGSLQGRRGLHDSKLGLQRGSSVSQETLRKEQQEESNNRLSSVTNACRQELQERTEKPQLELQVQKGEANADTKSTSGAKSQLTRPLQQGPLSGAKVQLQDQQERSSCTGSSSTCGAEDRPHCCSLGTNPTASCRLREHYSCSRQEVGHCSESGDISTSSALIGEWNTKNAGLGLAGYKCSNVIGGNEAECAGNCTSGLDSDSGTGSSASDGGTLGSGSMTLTSNWRTLSSSSRTLISAGFRTSLASGAGSVIGSSSSRPGLLSSSSSSLATATSGFHSCHGAASCCLDLVQNILNSIPPCSTQQLSSVLSPDWETDTLCNASESSLKSPGVSSVDIKSCNSSGFLSNISGVRPGPARITDRPIPGLLPSGGSFDSSGYYSGRESEDLGRGQLPCGTEPRHLTCDSTSRIGVCATGYKTGSASPRRNISETSLLGRNVTSTGGISSRRNVFCSETSPRRNVAAHSETLPSSRRNVSCYATMRVKRVTPLTLRHHQYGRRMGCLLDLPCRKHRHGSTAAHGNDKHVSVAS